MQTSDHLNSFKINIVKELLYKVCSQSFLTHWSIFSQAGRSHHSTKEKDVPAGDTLRVSEVQ